MEITGIFSENFWYWAPILATLTVAATGAINGLFKITTGFWPQLTSWIIAGFLSVSTFLLDLISFGEPQWLGVVVLSFVIGLASNGIYDIPQIKATIDKWFGTGHSK